MNKIANRAPAFLLLVAGTLVFFIIGCKPKNVLPDHEYYAITPEGIQQLKIKGDTLKITPCNDSLHCAAASKFEYKIVESKQLNNYWLLYVEIVRNLSSGMRLPDKYQILSLVKSVDTNTVGFIKEDSYYRNLTDCKDKGGFNPNGKFTISYYTASFINLLKTYKPITRIGSSDFWLLKKSLVREAIRNKELIRHTHTGNAFMTDVTRELVNRSMIRQKINPVVNEEALKIYLKNLNNNISIK